MTRRDAPSQVGLLQGTLDSLYLRTLLSAPLTAMRLRNTSSAPQKNYSRSRPARCIPRSIVWRPRLDICLLGTVRQRQASQVLSPYHLGAHTARG